MSGFSIHEIPTGERLEYLRTLTQAEVLDCLQGITEDDRLNSLVVTLLDDLRAMHGILMADSLDQAREIASESFDAIAEAIVERLNLTEDIRRQIRELKRRNKWELP